jgi:His/Glu/Gln/Arg/opine family amino acid ABC transporter permease subunit
MRFEFLTFWSAVTSQTFLLAAATTLALTVVSHATAIVIAIPMALGLGSGSVVIRGAIKAYVAVFRSIPTLLQLLFFWNALPVFSDIFRESWYTPFLAAWIALSINEAAYQVEINRAALSAVGKGQIAAAKAFGFSPLKTFRFIVAPQAARVAIPPTVNEFITLLKATSLASVIALQELMTVTNQAVATTFNFAEYYAAAATYYFVIVAILTTIQARIERRFEWTSTGAGAPGLARQFYARIRR